MTTPYFSIVIPTFNRSELFPLAVRSILNQTFTDFEVIVSDNCSGDDTPDVARQFTDRRFRYVQTPRHYTIADSWEFARREAKGKFIMMLSDDDALVDTALQHFAHESARYDADFLFTNVAEYRDQTYPGPNRNSVVCPSFSASSRIVHAAEEFIGPLFTFRPRFNMHPSAFAFPKSIADYVGKRTGRFFWTNGVEYSAWPITALFAKAIVYIDLPLTVLGRTGKSWGANIMLCNPGKERIGEFIKDVDHERKHAPLNNFTMANLMGEGMLTAKSLFPEEFAAYEFDEVNYVRTSMRELKRRSTMGVDVSAEMEDTLRYAQKYPALSEEFNKQEPITTQDWKKQLFRRLRSTAADLGGRTLRRRLNVYQVAQKLKRGHVRSGFAAYGEDFGFSNVLECANFVGRLIQTGLLQNPATQPTCDGIMIESSIERS